MDEVELLNQFWAVAKHYDKVVTFNGRQLTFHFFIFAQHNSMCRSQEELARLSVCTEPHCDLAEQLTFYNVSGRVVRRAGSTSFFTARFLASIAQIARRHWHGREPVDGGRGYGEIAEYCLRDVFATVKLFESGRFD
ncbi:MAG: hypothetical protein CM1200mP29_15280 [Verrucomicrobiota bacterium]|nr:MAG: hypothetical protein CM1200mP29_15280 [Verrucomicrobiota bacterium]